MRINFLEQIPFISTRVSLCVLSLKDTLMSSHFLNQREDWSYDVTIRLDELLERDLELANLEYCMLTSNGS